MLKQILLRAVIGGLFVSVFALVGDILKPKRLAGLFGAAPSVALATLLLTIGSHGKLFAATEARSMSVGAVGFFVYSCGVFWLLFRHKISALRCTLFLLPAWFLTAFGLWFVFVHGSL
jgi:hypothetical protein